MRGLFPLRSTLTESWVSGTFVLTMTNNEGENANAPCFTNKGRLLRRRLYPAPARAVKTWGQELLGAAPGVSPVNGAIFLCACQESPINNIYATD